MPPSLLPQFITLCCSVLVALQAVFNSLMAVAARQPEVLDRLSLSAGEGGASVHHHCVQDHQRCHDDDRVHRCRGGSNMQWLLPVWLLLSSLCPYPACIMLASYNNTHVDIKSTRSHSLIIHICFVTAAFCILSCPKLC